MSNFLIFKAAFNNSATPAIGTYTAEGATAQFNRNTSISPDYYLYNTALYSAVQWFVPTAETTDFEFVADILTREWSNRVTYFIIADSTGTTRLRMWSVNDNWHFENSDSIGTSGTEYIGTIGPSTSGGFGVFHQFRVRVRKLTASSSSVEVYVDGTLKLTATAGAALITCAKIGFVGGVNSFGPGTGAGIKNAYVYDLSGGDVIDRGVLSGAFNRFISWMKSKFALKSDIPTVNNGTLTIQKNGTNVATFTANQSAAATANITVPTKTSDLTNDSGFITSDNTKIPLAGSNAISGSLIPATTDAYNLGSNSYFWKNSYINNIYAKQYNVNTPYLNTRVVNIAKPNNPSSYLAQDIVLAKDLNGKLVSKCRVDVSTTGSTLCSFYVVKNNSTDDNELSGYSFSVNTSGETTLAPSGNNSTKLGESTSRWKEIWCTQSSINSSSDERQKQQIKPIDNDLLDAWENVNPIEFKWNDAVAEKGDNARIHTGYIAQNIQQALTENGVNPNDYGLFLYDEWGEEQEEKDEQGNIVRPYRPSGNAYGLRYTEALVVECMYLRRCIERLTARIEELEKGNNTK